jgi:MFS family permease
MIGRLARAYRSLAPEQRRAAVLAFGLFLTMFLPWYTRDTTAVVQGRLQTVSSTLIAWKAFSFVEAAILVVAVAVLALLFARAERRGFHLPGGDGLIIMLAGIWVALLVFYRLIDNKTGASSDFQKVDYGVTWGIFVTLLCGVALAYTGHRLRQAQIAEPPLPEGAGEPGDQAPTVADRRAARAEARVRERAPSPVPHVPSEAPGEPSDEERTAQLRFDDQE